MDIGNIFLLLLACCGLTFTIVHAEIMDILKIRPLLNKFDFTSKLIKCSLCTGTWTGLFVGLLFLETKQIFPFVFASAALSFLFERLSILLDELVMIAEDERRK